jgi:putative DNA primase/helicase
MWLDVEEPAGDWIVFRNRIVNARTSEERELTHQLWSHSGLGFDWDHEAECETWWRFLDDLFGDDGESVTFLMEFMGYCMTDDVRFDKGGMLIGPKRSGKSTIVNLIGKLTGEGAYAGLSLNDWLSSPKATQVLIGKRVLAFSDVRLKPEKWYGQSYDAGGMDHRSRELMLKITGRDKVSIPRLYAEAWNGVLPSKIILTSNEVVNFNDESGVLPTRFIKLAFRKSFAGREDVDLRDKLAAELPGIAKYCLGNYQRLCEHGAFLQPQSAAALERALLAVNDPFAAMARECFVPDPAGMVVKATVYGRFELWCYANRREDLLRKVPPNQFGDRLRCVAGFENLTDYRPGGQPRHWIGIRLRQG